jgi:hypothetical protein
MIARPPMTPPTMAPTGAWLEEGAAVAEDVDDALGAPLEGVAGAGVDATAIEIGDEMDVEVANVLVGVEDGAAVDEGGF